MSQAVKPKAEKLNRLMALLNEADGEDRPLSELCEAVFSRKNRQHALAFARVPYDQRLVLLPHCLRATAQCVADEEGPQYVCRRCGACKVGDIAARATELGYLGVRILKGGSAVASIVEDCQPKAVLGVACGFEGALGMMECERLGLVAKFVPLLRDGCADTDVDLTAVVEAMEFSA